MTRMIIEVIGESAMKNLGSQLGELLKGGEVIELVGDVGAGKTTLTKGICRGAGVKDEVQSPTFTLSRMYDTAHQTQIAHYDFYRLNDPGIMAAELQESIADPKVTTIIEWAAIIEAVLPDDRLTVSITSPSEDSRHLALSGGGPKSIALIRALSS